MGTVCKSILVLTCLMAVAGLVGCEQAEEAKDAAGKIETKTAHKTRQAVGNVIGNTEESDDEGKKKKEDAEPAEDKANEKNK